jgi:hypothetical protein
MSHKSFPAFCLRRMEVVDDDACIDCFRRHPQLRAAHRLRARCCEEELIPLQEAIDVHQASQQRASRA